jgi:cysteine-rich repeat protein
VKGAETCDDSNTNNGDGCSSTCTVEANYECPSPRTSCNPICGDGKKIGNEVCDTNGAPGCINSCSKVDPHYTCSTNAGTKLTTCTPICGDYIVVSPETCDDGNTADGEGCSSTCQIETGYNCPQGHDCFVKCGNGIITSPEDCDDGNENNGDGCSSTCKFEKGWSHTGVSPNFVFTNTCFNSVLNTNEDCDFGSGDQSCKGCDSHCGAAKGWTCTANVCTS